ncbi:MAG TPA: isoleucine--tRNA ligase [Pirellulales bacterium]|jgi:isoleucyl-tRNA synthetase|nr:isoleucine--tRNA ligase [Pirellulales bacterium]
MFEPVEGSVRFPLLESEILRFWKDHRVYEQSLARRAGRPRFVFYEGPPTANGLPHPAHCLTRAIKDLFPRYRTMRGFLCERKAGWDTHGLPVEVEVCKELGIHSKDEIEAYGVEPFIHRCLESVFRYTRQWELMTERIGFWVNLDQAYVTFHQSYVESVWWALKNLFDRQLLYQGHKIVWWWAQGGTALSSGEVGQGYREVADPSVYVRFPLVAENGPEDEPETSLLVWTTTPWTLPSNQFAAVHPDIQYALVDDADGQRLIVAEALVETLAGKAGKPLTVLDNFLGEKLVGRRYLPPFDYYHKTLGDNQGRLLATGNKPGSSEYLAWRVVPADFVTVESGTGIVHQAPAFGEVDYDVLMAEQARFVPGEGPQLICAVGPDGKFTAEAPDYQGRWVKEADKDIARALRHRGLLYHQEQYLHEYPFCWRAEEDPLIQYPRKSWFIRTTAFKEAMLANNHEVTWLPEHIRDGRFGNFLEANVDWALSRERYWGTPLPIWVSDRDPSYREAVGSYRELLAKPGVKGTEVWDAAKRANPALSDHLKVHKPYIDAVTYDGPNGARMRRVPEVIDCWFDSGAMPFAQWGYPHQGHEEFRQQFPADFISEGIDQTRGWFYSQLATSTMLWSNDGDPARGGLIDRPADAPTPAFPHPFRNCIVLGLMLGEDGQKMSKSKRNYREPGEILDRYGADALRWYFFANQPPWTSIRYNEQAIKDSIPEFLLRLWHTYSFFTIYANIDGFDPAARLAGIVPRPTIEQLSADELSAGRGYRPVVERSELDRWILGELAGTVAAVIERMDAYDNYAACQQITEFVDALSNWYVRRSRDRFWAADRESPDKLDAHWTLYECLLTTTKLVAPFVPFVAEAIWQNLGVAAFQGRVLASVHWCDFPGPSPEAIDPELSARMRLVREVVSQGRSARMAAKLKVRQPLAKVEVILADRQHLAWLEEHRALVAEELNVKEVEYPPRADQYISYTVLPDLKRLGPRLGKRLPAMKAALAAANAAELFARLEHGGHVSIELPDGPVALDSDDVQVRLQAKPGWAAAQGPAGVVVLSTELTPELLDEGTARELTHAIAGVRRDMDCQYTDRILVGLATDDVEVLAAVEHFAAYIQSETLAVGTELGPLDGVEPQTVKIGPAEVQLYVKVVSE